MATRSFIARTLDSGFEGVYCHWDGYLSHNGLLLNEHYSNDKHLGELLSHGDISILKAEIGEKHTFEQGSARDDTTFYGRDCGESNVELKRFNNLDEVVKYAAGSGCEFIYLFDKNKWRYLCRGPQFFGTNDKSPFGEFKLLEPELAKILN